MDSIIETTIATELQDGGVVALDLRLWDDGSIEIDVSGKQKIDLETTAMSFNITELDFKKIIDFKEYADNYQKENLKGKNETNN